MHLTPRFRAHRHAEALERIARSFLPHFPELRDLDFELDLLPSSSRLLGVAEGARDPPRVRLRPARPSNPSLTYTVPHELTHLLQRPLRLVPDGERACDLFAMARAGERFRIPPAYLKLPPSLAEDWLGLAEAAAALARGAVEERSAGRRNYITWWEEAVRDHVSEDLAVPEPSLDPWD